MNKMDQELRWNVTTDHMSVAPDTLLTRSALAHALQAHGYPVAAATLSTKATRGGGPPYSLFSKRALYRWGDALTWAKSCLTQPRHSTSEADQRTA